jgi:hypothetical protein
MLTVSPGLKRLPVNVIGWPTLADGGKTVSNAEGVEVAVGGVAVGVRHNCGKMMHSVRGVGVLVGDGGSGVFVGVPVGTGGALPPVRL